MIIIIMVIIKFALEWCLEYDQSIIYYWKPRIARYVFIEWALNGQQSNPS